MKKPPNPETSPYVSHESPETILWYFQPQEKLGAKKYVLKRMLELIERGKIKVGDQIASPAKIGKRIGKSDAVVYAAFRELRDWGLFETRGYQGTFLARTTKLKAKISRPKRAKRCENSRRAYEDFDFDLL